MRSLAFIVAILGLFLLSLSFGFEKEVDALDGLEPNSKVVIQGKIIEERFIHFRAKLLILDSGLEIVCDCTENFLNKKVIAEGIIEEYNGKNQARTLKIESIE